MWLDILRRESAAKGPVQVAKELGVSRSTVDLACQGKYPANTGKIEARVMKIYGHNGGIQCDILGDISADDCATNWRAAQKYNGQSANPIKLKLYRTCLGCSVRR